MRTFAMNEMKFPLALLVVWLPLNAFAQFGGGTAPVELSEARYTTMAPTMQVAGTVVSRSSAFLSAEVEGRLVEVAEVGTRVEAGAMVARIEDTQLRLRRDELASERLRAQARLKFLEAELRRFERLAETNMAAASQIEQTRSERDIAASDLAIVENRFDQIEDQLERTRIAAPFPGVVVERVAQAGERVATGTRVVRMVNPQHLEVVARAPLSYYRYVRPGDELAVSVGGELIHAPLRTVVSVGDEARHVFELRLDIEAAFPVGQTVRVTVPTADVREVLAVPRDALVLRGDGIAVFIIDDDNKARRIRVTTGIGEGEWIEVRGPIQPGDKVVIRGNERLRQGQEVSVQES